MSNPQPLLGAPDPEPMPEVFGWFRALDCAQAEQRWPEMAAVLDPVLRRMAWAYLPEDIRNCLATGKMRAFTFETDGNIRAVLVAEVLTFPRSRCLSLVAVAGEGLKLWRHHMGTLVQYAREMGFQRIVNFGGRDGWERALEGTGFTKIGNLYALDIAALDQLSNGVHGHA